MNPPSPAHHRRKDIVVPLTTVVVDALAIEGAFLLSYWLRFYSAFSDVIPVTLGFPPLSAYTIGSFVILPVWLWMFERSGMYRPRRITHFSDEFFVIVRIVAAGLVVMMAVGFLYRDFSFSRLVVVLVGIAAVLCISAGRFATMKFEQWWYRRGHDLRRVVIVGMSAPGRDIFDRLTRNPSLGYTVLGYFSAGKKNAFAGTKVSHLGRVEAAPDFARSNSVDVILVAPGTLSHEMLADLIRNCEGLQTEIMMVPDLVDLMTSQVRVRHIEGIPFLGVKGVALGTINQIVKRAFDLVFASIALVLVSPILLVIVVAIRLDSRGPLLYRQERVGLDGEVFQVLKFRSMRTDAERTSGPVWASKDDPRTTRVGRFLRRFSLDELPQLLNVLRGDMSIVGPRPERPHFVDRFSKQVPRYKERHRMKTGMTGWAQVNGLRGNAPIEERTKFDVFYVENWSLVFDLKIIFKTIRAVFLGEDAY